MIRRPHWICIVGLLYLLFAPLYAYDDDGLTDDDSFQPQEVQDDDSDDDSSTYNQQVQGQDEPNNINSDDSDYPSTYPRGQISHPAARYQNQDDDDDDDTDNEDRRSTRSYQSLPSTIPAPGEKVIIVDPNAHAFGAYSKDGKLLRSGMATSGANWCPDIDRPCRTRSGTFRIYTLGSSDCISHKFPVGRGGAPMPYCMYFNGGQGLHGSYEVVAGNESHGCVRLHVDDAEWIRFNFATIGTKVVIRPYH